MDKKVIIKYHIIFWIVVFSISLLQVFIYVENILFLSFFINALWSIIWNCCSFYTIYFLISEKLLNKRGIILLVIFGLIYLIFSSVLFTIISYYVYMHFFPDPIPAEYTLTNWLKSITYDVVAVNTIFLILGSLSRVSLIWYRNRVKQKDTEKQNLANELAMLRAQINPHFLFNTLNNIKSLVNSLPSKAIYSLEKLIDIMHYMLYQSSYETVPLECEIKHINNYLDLEKIRYDKLNFVDFKVSGDYSEIMIPPLIFMPFIENAVKHGSKLKQNPGINISFEISESNILFKVTNYIKANSETNNRSSGFGLLNIRRRLDLLFEGKYELSIKNENNIFSIKLNLNLQ